MTGGRAGKSLVRNSMTYSTVNHKGKCRHKQLIEKRRQREGDLGRETQAEVEIGRETQIEGR